MQLSDAGVKFLKEREGVVRHVYKDPVGILTAGVGHVLTDQELKGYKEGDRVSDEVIDRWLREDVKVAEDCISRHVTLPLSQDSFDALVSFIFNIGIEAFRKSTLLKLLNRGELEDVAHEFDRWVHAGGNKKVLAGLRKRRELERNLFLKGVTNELA